MVTRLVPTEVFDSDSCKPELLQPAAPRENKQDVPRATPKFRESVDRIKTIPSGKPLDRFLRSKLLQASPEERKDDKARDFPTFPIAARLPRLRRKQHNVQDHAIVGGIRSVPMRAPVRAMKVKFDIAPDRSAGDLEPGIPEIRSPEQVPASGMRDTQRPAVEEPRGFLVKIPHPPDLLEQALRKGEGTVQPLDFLDRFVGGALSIINSHLAWPGIRGVPHTHSTENQAPIFQEMSAVTPVGRLVPSRRLKDRPRRVRDNAPYPEFTPRIIWI